MIHRLALVIGGSGAAGVLALALALGGFGGQLSAAPDEFVPTGANQALGGGQISQPAAPTPAANLGGGDGAAVKVVDTVYVLPTPDAPAADTGKKPTKNNHPAADTPNDPSTDQNDDGDDGDAEDDEDGDAEDEDHFNEDDPSNTGDHANEDGGHDDDGSEPGDD